MKIHRPKKLGLWMRVNLKLLSWGSYIARNPTGLFYTLIIALILIAMVIGLFGYSFLNIALTTNPNYFFGFGIMCIIEILIIRGFFKLKHFKMVMGDINQEQLIDMFAGDTINPIIDKIKGKK